MPQSLVRLNLALAHRQAPFPMPLPPMFGAAASSSFSLRPFLVA